MTPPTRMCQCALVRRGNWSGTDLPPTPFARKSQALLLQGQFHAREQAQQLPPKIDQIVARETAQLDLRRDGRLIYTTVHGTLRWGRRMACARLGTRETQ